MKLTQILMDMRDSSFKCLFVDLVGLQSSVNWLHHVVDVFSNVGSKDGLSSSKQVSHLLGLESLDVEEHEHSVTNFHFDFI